MMGDKLSKMKKRSKYMIVTGIVLLLISIPTFVDYNMFPKYSSETR